MNRRRITAETKNPKSVGNTIAWGIVTGIGLGIGFLIVNKASKKLEAKYG